MRKPNSWLHWSCDSLARSVFLCARFCQPFSSPPPPLPLGFVGFSPLMFSVWWEPVPFLSCGGSWLGCAVVPVMGALFQSRGWLPVVEAPGYSRHPTSILAMQLLNAFKCNSKELTAKSAWSAWRSAVFGMHMPSGWLDRSCDSLAQSVFLRARFCQPFSSPPPSP